MRVLPRMLPRMKCSDFTDERLEEITGDSYESDAWRKSALGELIFREGFTERTLRIILSLLHEICDEGKCEILLGCCTMLHDGFRPPAMENELVARICEYLRSESLRVFWPLALLIRGGFDDPLVIDEAKKIISCPLEFEANTGPPFESDSKKELDDGLLIALHGFARDVVAGKQPLPTIY